MSGNVTDLLNFTLDESSIISGSGQKHERAKQSLNNNLLHPEIGKTSDGRKSLDNNPFDKVSKQVETFSADPFEFVLAQSTNKPVLSCIRTGNLLGLGDDSLMIDNKENNNNGGNVSLLSHKGEEVRFQSTI